MDQKPIESDDHQKVDRRVQRTRLALRDALFELIDEKGYDAVSVDEITRRANLGRATFYLHFKDKDDLLLNEFNAVTADRVKVLSEIPLSFLKTATENEQDLAGTAAATPLELVFQHAAENADLYRILLRGQSSQRLSQRVREMVKKAVDDIIQHKQKNDPTPFELEIPTGLLAAYFSGALLSTIDWWLDQDEKIPPEELARKYQHLFFPGVRKVFGFK